MTPATEALKTLFVLLIRNNRRLYWWRKCNYFNPFCKHIKPNMASQFSIFSWNQIVLNPLWCIRPENSIEVSIIRRHRPYVKLPECDSLTGVKWMFFWVCFPYWGEVLVPSVDPFLPIDFGSPNQSISYICSSYSIAHSIQKCSSTTQSTKHLSSQLINQSAKHPSTHFNQSWNGVLR